MAGCTGLAYSHDDRGLAHTTAGRRGLARAAVGRRGLGRRSSSGWLNSCQASAHTLADRRGLGLGLGRRSSPVCPGLPRCGAILAEGGRGLAPTTLVAA